MKNQNDLRERGFGRGQNRRMQAGRGKGNGICRRNGLKNGMMNDNEIVSDETAKGQGMNRGRGRGQGRGMGRGQNR